MQSRDNLRCLGRILTGQEDEKNKGLHSDPPGYLPYSRRRISFAMRLVVLEMAITLDGYIARHDGSVDFLFMPRDKAESMREFSKTVDAVIMGRKTYEVAKAMGGGFGGKIVYYVMSRSLPEGERESVIFTRESPGELIARLRRNHGKNLWLMGGGELIREFLRADLINEINLSIVPVLLGDGIRAFPSGFPQREFTMVESRTYSQGLVSLKYERAQQRKGKAR